jgi:hypothetical protein
MVSNNIPEATAILLSRRLNSSGPAVPSEKRPFAIFIRRMVGVALILIQVEAGSNISSDYLPN